MILIITIYKNGTLKPPFIEMLKWTQSDGIFKQLTEKISTSLRCGSFSEKIWKKSTCAVMIRITVTFANQILL